MRGDGPPTKNSAAPPASFSPRAWGWSDVLRKAAGRAQRSPHVRGDGPHNTATATVSSPCSPHVRGDGPLLQRLVPGLTLFSPRAWGWSGRAPEIDNPITVLPTCVGMVLDSNFRSRCSLRSPHVRGDGPRKGGVHNSSTWTFSPRAWGWSAVSSRRRIWVRRSPHVRGDGPQHLVPLVANASVLPTCVGMVRIQSRRAPAETRSPHVRGDGPDYNDTGVNSVKFSPRAWGWSVMMRSRKPPCRPLQEAA